MTATATQKKTESEIRDARLKSLAKAREVMAINREAGRKRGRNAKPIDRPEVARIAEMPRAFAPQRVIPEGLTLADLVPQHRPTLQITVELVTPEIAAEWLKLADSRPIRRSAVKRYMHLMQTGQWRVSDSNVCFDTNGKLRNAIHRLTAVVESGLPQMFTVGRGYAPDDYEAFDTNVKRTIGDYLTPTDANRQHKAAVVKGTYGLRALWAGRANSLENPLARPSIHEARELDATENFDESVLWGQKVRSVLHGSLGIYGAVHHELALIDHDQAAQFFEALATGLYLGEGDPEFRLRHQIMITRGTPGGTWTAAVCIKAWNRKRSTESTYTDKQILVWKPAREQFPVPK